MLFLLAIIFSYFTTQVSPISQLNLVYSPKFSILTQTYGELTISIYWTSDFKVADSDYDDIIFRIVFPFKLTENFSVLWAGLSDPCYTPSSTIATTSIPSEIDGDEKGAHFILMKEAYYVPKQVYSMEITITELPLDYGLLYPIKAGVVSSMEDHFIYYAYNNILFPFNLESSIIDNFEFDLSVITDVNKKYFSRDFSGLADVQISEAGVTKLLLKLTDSYRFADDAESSCSTELDQDLGIYPLESGSFYCAFETDEKVGLAFIWNVGYSIPTYRKFRIKFRVKNPSIPGSSELKVALMSSNGPKVLQFKRITNAFECGPIPFRTGYPKLYLGPNLDPSENDYPNLPLFTMGSSLYTIVFNSIALTFYVSVDLPTPDSYYVIEIIIGGNGDSLIPENSIYHNLPAAPGERVRSSVSDIDATISILGVGKLSSLTKYTIGFKIAFYGSESLSFSGNKAFCSIFIYEIETYKEVVSQEYPSGLSSYFKNLVTNGQPTSTDYTTFFHAITSSSTLSDYTGIDATTYYGLNIGGPFDFFLKSNMGTYGTYASFTTQNNGRSYIEVITSSSIYAEPASGETEWYYSDASTNCINKDDTGTDLLLTISDCYFNNKFNGVPGLEHSLFKISAYSASFWSTASTLDYYFGWKGVYIPKSHSLFADDEDVAILDTYVRIYQDCLCTKVSSEFLPNAITYEYLDNMIVLSFSAFSQTVVDFPNFFWSGLANSLDGSSVPQFMRVSGLLDGIDNLVAKRMIIFFHELQPLYVDYEDEYEVACSTSSMYEVRCYHHKGAENKLCASTPVYCSNYLFKDWLEIVFDTEIISLATTHEIQVLIAVTVPPVTSLVYNFAYGVGKLHTEFTQFIQLLTFNIPSSLSPPTIYTLYSDLFLSDGEINEESSTQEFVVKIHTSVQPQTGTTTDQYLDLDCPVVDECVVTEYEGTYYSVTYCAPWNFMESDEFSVFNLKTEDYEECAYNIHYEFENVNTLDIEDKYCFWCPVWQDGAEDEVLEVLDFYAPFDYGLVWPSGTWGGISGRSDTYGIYYLTENELIQSQPFITNGIQDTFISPTTFFDDYKSMKVVITMTTTNPIPENGYIKFDGNGTLPFSFTQSPNSFCYIEFGDEVVNCESSVSSNLLIVQTLSKVSAGEISILLYGIEVNNKNDFFSISFIIYTTSALGYSSDYYIDESSSDAITFVLSSYSSEINIMSIPNIDLFILENNITTNLLIKVEVGNSKKIYENDKIIIDLGDSAYDPTHNPLHCLITNTNGEILSYFKSCSTSNLNEITILASRDTQYESFIVNLTNFKVPLENPSNGVVGRIESKTETSKWELAQNISESTSFPTFSNSITLQLLNLTKTGNLISARPDYTFTLKPSNSSVFYTSIVYIIFPDPYNPLLSEFPISCYEISSDWLDKEELACWIWNDRTLAVSGFHNIYLSGDQIIIKIIGVEQPKLNYYLDEEFYVLLDNDDDPKQILEKGYVNGTQPVDLKQAKVVTISDVQFSHNKIRSNADVQIQFYIEEDVPKGYSFHVYFDFLKNEYAGQNTQITCTFKQDTISLDSGSSCERYGNRYNYTSTSNITANVKYTLYLNDVPTPDYEQCLSKKIQLNVLDDKGFLKHVSTSFIYTALDYDFLYDSSKKYCTFYSMDYLNPIILKRGVFNKILVVRDLTTNRVDDDLKFQLTLNPFSKFELFVLHDYNYLADSLIGITQYPLHLSIMSDVIYGEYNLRLSISSRVSSNLYQNLPVLKIKVTGNKAKLKIPEKIIVYRGYQSFPFVIQLDEIPLNSVTFNLNFLINSPDTILSIEGGTSIFVFNSAVEALDVTIISGEPISSTPLPDAFATLVLEATDTNSPYESSEIDIIVRDIWVYKQNKFDMKVIETEKYGVEFEINTYMPANIYYYMMPTDLYANYTSEFIYDEIMLNTNSFDFVSYGQLELHEEKENFYFEQENTLASTSYTFVFYFETLWLDDITSEYYKVSMIDYTDFMAAEQESAEISTDVEGEVINLFEGVFSQQVEEEEAEEEEEDSLANNFKTILYDSVYYFEEKTADIESRDAYLNITFEGPFNSSLIPSILCFLGNYLVYPIENIYDIDGRRCSSLYPLNSTLVLKHDSYLKPLAQSTDTTSENINVTSDMFNRWFNVVFSGNNTYQKPISQLDEYEEEEEEIAVGEEEESLVSEEEGSLPTNEEESQTTRNLQLNIIDLTNYQNTQINEKSSVLQIFFYKNIKSFQESSAYTRIQLLVIEDAFLNALEENFPDLPKIINIQPLISLQLFTPLFVGEPYAVVPNKANYVDLINLKIKKQGIIYFMLIKDNELNEYVTYQHILYGVDMNLNPAVYSNKFSVSNARQELQFSVYNLERDQKYTFYFYATNINPTRLSPRTEIKKLSFYISPAETMLWVSNLLFSWIVAIFVASIII